jgi:hypothetical protein
MHSRQPTALTPLLWRLLETYERRWSERGEPPQRDTILKLGPATFPDAWAPDGAEARDALYNTAIELEKYGAVRVVRGRGPLRSTPVQVRLGEAEASFAYSLAAREGFLPLLHVANDAAARVASLRGPHLPVWMDEYLSRAVDALSRGELSALPVSVVRFKDDPHALTDAFALAAELSTGRGGMERILSERATGQSKRLDSLRGMAANILVTADPRWRLEPRGNASEIVNSYGIRRKPLFLFCAGGIRFRTPFGERCLLDDTPSAAVAEGLFDQLADAISVSGPLTITTVENETPYHLYIEEAGGPSGLAARGELVIYIAGWPASAVTRLLHRAAHGAEVRFRHWGDPDSTGFQIWWRLRQGIGREVAPFRVGPEWIARAAEREAKPLSVDDEVQLRSLQDLLRAQSPRTSDIVAAISSIEAVLDGRKWIEQERFYSCEYTGSAAEPL